MALDKTYGLDENCHMALEAMRKARKAKNLSQEKLAEAIDISVSQISRFESGQRQPRFHEMIKISEFLEIPLEVLRAEMGHDISLIEELQQVQINAIDDLAQSNRRPSDFQEEGVPYRVDGCDYADKDIIAHLLRGRPNAHPWTMKSDVLALKGICAGDILIIDQSVAPKNGDVVLAQVEEGVTARTVFRVYQMPNIIGAAFDPTAIRPEIVDGERVRIAGVMTDLLRRRG